MRVLVDTHVFLWAVQDQPRLPRAVRALLAAPHSEVWISVISIFEVRQKHDAGRLPLRDELVRLVDDFEAMSHGLLPLKRAHALVRLPDPPPTADPFDRLLLAQCEAEGMRLLTVDRRLRDHRLAAPLARGPA